MSGQRRKRVLPIQEPSTSGRNSPSPQRTRNSSRTSDEALDQFTALMTAFLQRTAEQSQLNIPTIGGDAVPEFNPEAKGQTVETWCRKVDELRAVYKWSEEATIYFAMSKLRGLAEVWYKGLPSVNFTWTEWKEKLELGFPSKRNYHADLQAMMNRTKRSEESYAKYYYEKMALLNRCKIQGTDAVSCIIGGIYDNVVKTGASAGNHQTPESLYGYLTSLTTEKNRESSAKVSGITKVLKQLEEQYVKNRGKGIPPREQKDVATSAAVTAISRRNVS
ncbi:hypothetical protein NQ318_018512 [Aromia moschata]|uniref:Retrotransposon gag domain-containing protein n=1 Tax=Aromia moschata TaxID=1265417 RepID=A0AAV8ZIA2_9CUCU|nr:hypothetical protein NQ318_018512 [Aromia moschata]